MADAYRNFATSTVATAPSPAVSGTSLVVAAGHGTRFPAVPFNAVVCPATGEADPLNAEVVRVTAVATDTLTIVRAQESSTARTIVVGDLIYQAVTAKTVTDLTPDLGTWHAPARLGAITNSVPGANSLRFVHVVIPQQALLTGIAYIVGTTSNGNVKAGLFDAAGARVAQTTGTVAQAAINTNQKVAFDSPVSVPPGVYFLAAILSSATGTWYNANGAVPSAAAAPGSFDVPASITVPTTSAGAIIPVLTTY